MIFKCSSHREQAPSGSKPAVPVSCSSPSVAALAAEDPHAKTPRPQSETDKLDAAGPTTILSSAEQTGAEAPRASGSLTIDPARVATADFTPTDRRAPGPVIALRLSGQSGSLPELQGEIGALLQSRLRIVGVLAAGGWSTLLALFLSGKDTLFRVENLGQACTAMLVATTFICTACAVVLYARPRLSLRWLRFQEVLLFGLSALSIAWFHHAALSEAVSDAAAGTSRSGFALEYAVAFSNLAWMTVIAVYGVFVPNTWCRTLRGVIWMAVLLLAVDAYHFASHPAISLERLIPSIALTSLTLFMGSGIAVFGSFKISSLQQEAIATRRQLRDLGQYHLKERLGAGGMGEVYLAEHRLLKRPCAIKLIRPERAGDPQTLARFEREVQATARLTHPNTIEIYDYGHTDDGTFYYVMEYLDGESLEELVRREGPPSPARAVHLMRQLCGALREAHAAGMVHRDIKPSNVIISRRGGIDDVAKLLDFGLVRTTEFDHGDARLSHDHALLGTPQYMSPEQADAPQQVDARSDIYSLGCLLYFMLTGDPPFVSRSVVETLIAHRVEPVPPLRSDRCEISTELEAVVLRCLAKDPALRFADADSLD